MNCPHCNTINDPSNQFCEKCGKALNVDPAQAGQVETSIARDHLLAYTFRLIISLLGLWVINTVLVSLSFVKEIRIPQLPIPVTTIITLVIMIVVFFLLLGYARVIATLWPLGFPRMSEVGSVWTALIWIVLLGIAYRILKPIIQQISADTEPMMILQLVFILIAIVVVFRAGIIIYHAIPIWYNRIKDDWSHFDKSISK